MQIVKGNHNSQLKKNEGTHLKNESPRKYGTKAKTDPQSSEPLRWGGVLGNTMAGRHHGCPGGVPRNAQSKEENGERERTRTRCQGSARRQNTNDDDNGIKLQLSFCSRIESIILQLYAAFYSIFFTILAYIF